MTGTSLRRLQPILRPLGTVGGGMAIGSAIAYVLILAVARWLEPDDYATFLSLWGVIFGLGSVLSIVEQEVSRQSAHAAARGGRTPRAALQVFSLSATVACLACAAIALSPLGSSIMGGTPTIPAMVFASTLGLATQFLVRGILIGHDRVRAYSGLLIAEGAIRLALAAAAALLWTTGRLELMVGAVAAGSFAWLAFARQTRRLIDPASGGEAWGLLTQRVVVLTTSSGLTASLLSGYPALVTAVVGSTAGLATLFAVVSASRIPLLFLSPVQALAVPAIVRLVTRGHPGDLRRYLSRGALALAATAAIGGGLASLVGPWAIRTMFGEAYVIDSATVAILFASTVVIAGLLLEGAALVALQRYGGLLLAWGVAVASAMAALAWVPSTTVARGVAGMAVGAVTGATTATILLFRSTRVPAAP